MGGSISSSSSSEAPTIMKSLKYDVFVSFRGIDTRYNFTDHLFTSLRRKGIVAFRDDTKLKKGESIAPELLRAIEGSRVFVVVLSENYASSTWCLRELEHILDQCVQVSSKHVLPVFYDVDPSEVRKQSGSYADAFAQHENRFKQMVPGWRKALTRVANLSGWDMRDKPESNEIEKIVEEITNILGHKVSTLPNDLVGMHSSLKELEKLLSLDSSVDDVGVVGIWGMGGVGKTTLATVLYGSISHQFDARCFIDDLSKIYRDDGPVGAQKQILYQILGNEQHLINQICNHHDGANMMRSRLGLVSVLIILDNVDRIEQLEKLGVNRKCLGAGSKIIIISRDAHILNRYGVDVVYKVPLLNKTNSLQLFCQQALKHDNNNIIMSDYQELSYHILRYANGLPLAIKSLGSLLLGRDISTWRSALARLREGPNKDIMDVLRLSFDGLEEKEEDIFLDIGCFFNGYEEKYVKIVMDCCGFHPEIGLRVLIDKSLISISEKTTIEMHGLLEELGRKICQQKESRKWTRVWLPEHFNNVMSQNMEKRVEAVVLRHEDKKETKILMAEALSKMSHLRLLILSGVNFRGGSTLTSLSKELRYLEWNAYPFWHLPSSFQPNLLVGLILKNSCIKELWEDKKYLPNLRTLDLSNSRNLIKIPDFGEFPNLERLNLKGCISLVEMDPCIGVVLRKLVYLNLGDCKNLKSIPSNIFDLSSLKYINLFGSTTKGFDMKDDSSESASSLPHSQSRRISSVLKQIASPFRSSGTTTTTSHSQVVAGQHPIPKCLPLPSSMSCLRELDIRFCGVGQIPDAIGSLRLIERLLLGGNLFVTLPSFRELSRLSCLNLESCRYLEALPELPSAVTIDEERDDMFSNTTTDDDHHRRTAGLHIFNCPSLNAQEKCKNIIRVVLSWMIQLMQANQESAAGAFFGEINVVIPAGSCEMPRWFDNTSKRGDTSICIDPSLIIHDDNFIAAAFCVKFYVEPYQLSQSTNGFKPVLDLCFVSGAMKVSSSIPVYANHMKTDDGSNHIWIAYFTRQSFFDLMAKINNAVLGNYFKLSFLAEYSTGLRVKVKNHGYRWVYKQDLPFNLTTILDCGNNSLEIQDDQLL